MNVAPVYHQVLKQLHAACRTRPHFVQDIRFLLSRPLYTLNETHAMTSGHDSTRSTESLSSKNSEAAITVDNYLQRPASTCFSIDTNALFALCYADLRDAVREPARTDTSVNPVAQQILRYRNLLWLKERLARVLSATTTQHLATSLSIAQGPTEDDFIPDSYFAKPKEGNAKVDGTEGAGNSPVEEGADEGSAATEPVTEDGSWINKEDTLTSAAVDESDPYVVHSAGAVGMQKEMFVLRHREPFPMASQYLSGLPTVSSAELQGTAHKQAALVQLVRDKYPTAVTCQDAHVRLSIKVEPHDPQYTTREHAGAGYFGTAHRQFLVQFTLEPLTRLPADEEEDEPTQILLVNSYFARLDVELMQLVEEVGYLHSRDVLHMLRERDYSDHYAEQAFRAAMGEGEDEMSVENFGKRKEEWAYCSSSKQREKGDHPAQWSFSLYFVNPSDSPMVLKGMLYYKMGARSELAEAPIKCIPFGFILMES